MHTRAKLATILRRLADRLSPVPVGDCGSGSTWITYNGEFTPPTGYTAAVPYVTSTDVGGSQLVVDMRFEGGSGWAPS